MHTVEQLRSGELKGVRSLKLSCGLTTLPPEIVSLKDTLEILDLSNNQLLELPADLANFPRLRIIFCSNNLFTELPEVLGACPELSMVGFKANRILSVSPRSLPPKLRWLILTDNLIKDIPLEIGRCFDLQKLMLAGNKLRQIPSSLVNCSKLELLRISANQLSELPRWLLDLPRLSWLTFSGNPFCFEREQNALAAPSVKNIRWSQLKLGGELGQGASGIIYTATLADNNAEQPVAVKMFKGAVTSDGLPSSEMAACIEAGDSENLIGAIASIGDHPDGSAGFVMKLIPSDYKNLAGPPNFDSCTRDVYETSLRFTLHEVLSIACDIAIACEHLHCQRIMHGDLYAHNILYLDEHGLLGDFGAASFYESNTVAAKDCQRLDVRAFGCLLEELIERLVTEGKSYETGQLARLKAACLSETLGNRPSFARIRSFLQALRDR